MKGSPRLNQALAGEGRHAILFSLHRELIALRKHPALQSFSFSDISAEVRSPRLLALSRSFESALVFIAFNFDQADTDLLFPSEAREWKKLLASYDHRWCGDREAPDLVAASETLSLPPHSFVVYERGD